MGKSGRTLVAILEGFLKFLFGAYHLTTLLVVKTIQNSPEKKIPPVQSDIYLQSATSLAKKIRRRELKSKDVVQMFINRIQEIHPILNFVVDERYSEALKEAENVDDFLKTTKSTEAELKENSPFLGVPCTIKESFAVKGMRHTVGLHSRKDIIADQDAPAVVLIRKSGAIPLVVTNTPELCCWWETYNPLHGRTSNAYNTRHTAGGSSGGECAAIAAASSVFGLGSDFGGSIRIPSAFNGIFGHRPTSQTTSVVGHYPVPSNEELKPLLISGPLTRYATDLKPMLKILSKDSAPQLDLDTPVNLKNIKIYYMEENSDMFLTSRVEPAVKAAVSKVAQHFQRIGAKVERVQLDRMKYAMMYWYAKVKTNDGPQLGKELANHNGAVSMATEFCKSLIGASKHTLPVILFGVLEAGNNIPYKGYLHSAVLDESAAFEKELKAMLGENAILLLPTHPTTAPVHREAIAQPFDIGYSAVFNVLGLPVTSCPVGLDKKGLPIGVQVVANSYNDRMNLAVAEEIEKVFGGWTPPFQLTKQET